MVFFLISVICTEMHDIIIFVFVLVTPFNDQWIIRISQILFLVTFKKKKINVLVTSLALLRSSKQINFYCWIFFCTEKKVFQENIDYDYTRVAI